MDFHLLISLLNQAKIKKNIKNLFSMKLTKISNKNNKLNRNQVLPKTWINQIKINQFKSRKKSMKLIKDLIF